MFKTIQSLTKKDLYVRSLWEENEKIEYKSTMRENIEKGLFVITFPIITPFF